MASSGGRSLFWFFFICFSVGAYLLWTKYCNNGNPNESSTTTVENKNLPMSLFSPDEACYLLNLNENARAGIMYERKYSEWEDKEDNSLVYNFTLHQYTHSGRIKFYKHSDFYNCVFQTKEGYQAFLAAFKSKEKKGAMGDCLERYVITGGCVACDMGFTRSSKGYQVRIQNHLE